MIEMHSKYGNMHTNRIFNALNCINNHVKLCINCGLKTQRLKKLGFLIFHCVLLALAIQKEKTQRLIIIRVWNTFLSEFLLFSIHSLCWKQDVKSGQNIQALEGMF